MCRIIGAITSCFAVRENRSRWRRELSARSSRAGTHSRCACSRVRSKRASSHASLELPPRAVALRGGMRPRRTRATWRPDRPIMQPSQTVLTPGQGSEATGVELVPENGQSGSETGEDEPGVTRAIGLLLLLGIIASGLMMHSFHHDLAALRRDEADGTSPGGVLAAVAPLALAVASAAAAWTLQRRRSRRAWPAAIAPLPVLRPGFGAGPASPPILSRSWVVTEGFRYHR